MKTTQEPTKPWWTRSRVAAGVLLVLAYLPLLASAPGKIPGDTKLYLYLDPWRLITDSLWTWDNRQLGGWVPHQNIGYIWPTGPWFWSWEAIGVADWIAHRLWLGTMLASAGLGTLWLARRLGLGVRSAFIAALAYQLSPYVLPYISRTSALLLPWALLPWLCGLAIAVALHRRWLHIALFALIVFSSGGLNATALLMIAPAPVIYIVHLWRNGTIDLRRLLGVTGILGISSVLVSAWWLMGLAIQGRYGAAVLSYSEALPSTAATSSAPEVLRGLGYWLFYDRNDVVPLTSASTPYQGNLIVMGAGGVLVIIGLWGIMRWQMWRWALLTSVLLGTVLAVGAFPFNDPSPLWQLAVDHPRHAFSLALRSSSRAVPVVTLALTLGIGMATHELSRRSTGFLSSSHRRRMLALCSVVMLIGLNLPALFGGRLIDPVMTRPNDLPAAWYDAASYLDQRFDSGHTGSVLLLPGIESAAYRWGYPVDPILPGLTKKPFISRDWLPLGSAPLMDLVYALDDSFQAGTASAAAIAPIARLLGADTVMVVNSHQYERFKTVRPERAGAVFDEPSLDLTYLTSFGAATENRARDAGANPTWSEELVAFPFQRLPEIELYAVVDPPSPARLTPAPGLIAGDGTGLVDLASAGVIDGRTLLINEAALPTDELQRALLNTPELVITDSNRRRAHHWRSSQEVWGATEPLDGVLFGDDLFDARLPVFPTNSDISQTVVLPAAVNAKASGYGPVLSFHPEHRPAMALDGDLHSSWKVGTGANPVGATLLINATDRPLSRLRLVQPQDPNPLRWITAIEFSIDDGPWVDVQLDSSSQTATGQFLDLPQSARSIAIRIAAISWKEPFGIDYGPGVGFAEVLDDDLVSPEVLEVPRRTLGTATPATSFSFHRLRVDPFARWRQDPEQTIERQFTTSRVADFSPSVTLRLSQRATDSVLLEALSLIDFESEMSMGANERLQGSASWWGMAALDNDPSTVWWTASRFDLAASDEPEISFPLSGPLQTLTLHQVRDDLASRLSQVSLDFRNNGEILETIDIAVPEPDERGQSRLDIPDISGTSVTVRLSGIAPTWVHDDATGLVTAAPVGINDITTAGAAPVVLPPTFDTGCREDLVTINGRGLALRLRGTVRNVLLGHPINADICGPRTLALESGVHRVSTSRGLQSGWDVDSIILRDANRGALASSESANITSERGRRQIDGTTCITSCWLEGPDGWNEGWVASIEGQALPPPRASAGGRNMWYIDSDQFPESERVILTWTPQRAMWWAIGITLGAIVALLATAAIDSRRRSSRRQSPAKTPSHSAASAASARRLMIGLTLLVSVLVISPWWGVILTVLVFIFRRHPRVLMFLGGGLVGLGLLFVIAQQIRTGAEPGFGWPSVFSRAHRPTLAGLVLVWVVVTAEETRFARKRWR